MKKIYLLALLSAIFCGLKVSAQSSLLATLNHEGTVSTFYGATALQEAHAAAASGDVITLSSGTFAGINITKAVTIRGAGMEVDSVMHTEPTVISNGFNIEVEDSIGNRLTMEGVYSNQTVYFNNLKNAMFLKCRFNTISNARSSAMNNLTFIHCRIANQYSLRSDGSSSFVNCILKDPSYGGYFSFNNCVILAGGGSLSNSEYKNCILVSTGSGASSSTYYNNLFISDTDLTNMTNTTNVRVSTSDERVANLIGDYSDSKTYELTEAAKAIMTGTDGKEVGIYGGNLPYTATPTNPQITKFEVASKSTADGKLSVDIEVNSAE